jgi:uncharacterized protein with von Willebrand factor type A (vWA) domain
MVETYHELLEDHVFVDLLLENLMEFLSKILPELIRNKERYLDVLNRLKEDNEEDSNDERKMECYAEYVDGQNRLLGGNDDYTYKYNKGFGFGIQDYEQRSKIQDVVLEYPVLDEIINLLGREQESDNKETDHYNESFRPLLLKHSSERSEMDGVSIGNNLSNLLPIEYALIDETLFYVRFVKRELQQFAYRNLESNKIKTEKLQNPQPRLERGPIIVAIDTSGSMVGASTKISKALLTNMVSKMRHQNRKLFLITYSVHTKALELDRPSQFRKVEQFFRDRFCGGTDGEEMFNLALDTLQTNNFKMADVLIISDFLFPVPLKSTAERIAQERSNETRFYGLCINGHIRHYAEYLDKFWNVETKVGRRIY